MDNYLLPLIAFCLACLLLRPRIRHSQFWGATVTPLASIIGSGFLIIAPLLAKIGGSLAPWFMLAIILISYAIGEIIRFNIRYAEPLFRDNKASLQLRVTEHFSNIALSVAYIISIAFYIRLLASFVLNTFGINSEVDGQILTTVVLLFIGVTGWRWGLHALERLEVYSVTIKLAIIGSLLVALFYYDLSYGFTDRAFEPDHLSMAERLRMLAGMLLVVQGFETSRYLGSEYSSGVRIRSMRFAQWVAAGIYLAFVFMITPLLHFLEPGTFDETAIIHLVSHVAMVLPFMLVGAAVMSQFSAATGDTLGAGGLVEEETKQRLPATKAYIVIVVLGIILVWLANIFEIVTLASRAFAVYYLAQAFVALQLTTQITSYKQRLGYQTLYGSITVLLIAVVIFAIPVG
ncbi:MAG: hypothetical protein DRQ39_07715 [Gammaproteobacteria bacterium]|nr:MAG: hypothetical protein DRQ39_07715 [Gammaproteobacteria bacterium]RLA01884.1 MAG: hypothetical protein DRQ42_02125 [Gammaproteobacteria bacterium]